MRLAGMLVLALLALAFWPATDSIAAAPARAQAVAAAPELSRAEAAALLAVLNDPAQRARLIATLHALELALPAASAPTAPGAAAAPAAKPAASAAAAKPVIPIAPNGVLVQLLHQMSAWISGIAGEILSVGSLVNGLPELWYWLAAIASEPGSPQAMLTVSAGLVVVLGLAGALGWLLRRLVRPSWMRLSLYADTKSHAPAPASGPHGRRLWRPIRLLPLALLRLALELLPVAGFALVGNVLANLVFSVDSVGRPVAVALVNAGVAFGVIMSVTRMLASPYARGLRLLQISDAAALYITRWMRWLAGVAIFGMAAAGLGAAWGMYPDVYLAVQKLILLVDHVFLVIIVLQRRRQIAERIAPHRNATGPLAGTLKAFAGVWHYIAIFFIVGLWLVWAADLRDGYVRLWHIAVVTCAVLAGARLLAAVLLTGLDHMLNVTPQMMAGYPGFETRAARYHSVVRSAVTLAVAFGAVLVLLESWGIDSFGWFTANPIGQQLIGAIMSIGITILIAVIVWEAVNLAIDRHLDRLTRAAQLGRAARMRTVLPILRTALMVTVLIVAGLTTLGQIGVNIGPLLAGAGIVGVAIGFGSQKLVQDFITGIFLLLESAMQVGDFVTLAGVSGTVEHLSIRTIRLRAGDGSVHLIPFSSVTTVNNTNRGVGNAAVSVNISADEDTDQVGDILKQIVQEMRADDAFKDKMRSELQLWGVDKVDGAMVTLVGQIVCTDAGRWGVQREFNRRYKKRFQELGIAIPMATQTVLLRREAPADAPLQEKAEAPNDPGPSSATMRESPPDSSLGNTS
jgi:small-conductance mechanosensitive channel